MKWLQRHLPRRLSLQLMLLVLLTMLLPQMWYTWHMANAQAAQIEAGLRAQAQALTRSIADDAAHHIRNNQHDILTSLLQQLLHFPGVRALQITDPAGRILAVAGAPILIAADVNPLQASVPAVQSLQRDDGILQIGMPIGANESMGWVKVEYSLASIREARHAFWIQSLSTGFFVLLFSAGVIWLCLLRPLASLRAATNFANRLDYHGGEQITLAHSALEFEELTQALNAASLRLQQQSLTLTSTQEAAIAANRAKSDFLAHMSHEIRTPLNAVLGFAHICLMQELPERARAHLGNICSAAESLLGIINQTLDFSKIGAGKMTLEHAPFDLGVVLHQVATLFRLKAREKNVELVIGVLPDIPDQLVGDSLRLKQILVNLIGNALKFTECGEISLVVALLPSSDGRINLRFEVRDTGIGMSSQQLSRLFTPFTQADTSTTRRYGGTGLGLAISKHLAELMGGDIYAESRLGLGSCFVFTACFDIAADGASAAQAYTHLAGKKVLIVDDSLMMRTVLISMVQSFACEALAVDSGEAALAHIQSGEQFDIILMDWYLDGIDGLDAAHDLRANGNSTPIILITGSEQEMARSKAPAGEIQAILPKPVVRSILYDTMLNCLAGQAIPLHAPSRIAIPCFKGQHLLLVDDNDFNRQVGRELIEMTGATLDTANNGAQAMEAVSHTKYDLILMDLQMPLMDGYTTTRLMREQKFSMPILALTAQVMKEEKTHVLEVGMNAILTKPILPAALYAALCEYLPEYTEISLPTLQQEPVLLSTSSSASRWPPDSPDITPERFDLNTALSRVNFDHGMLQRFLHLFRERNAQCMNDIEASMRGGDLAAVRRQVHALKGGAGTVGLLELHSHAMHLENLLSNDVSDNDPEPHLPAFMALQNAWARAMQTLAALLDGPTIQ